MGAHDISKSASNFSFGKILINGFEINPKNVTNINIYEGLTSPALTGRIYIADRQAILEIHEVMAGDYIEIEFTTKATNTSSFRFKGIIISNDGSSTHADQSFPTICLQFCSEWWFKASTKQVSKSYKNQSIDDIFYDLIENECGGIFNGFNPNKLEKIERFVSPYWTPAHIMKYLLGLTTGYVLYENFAFGSLIMADSLSNLYAQGTNADNLDSNDIMMSPENAFYVGGTNSLYNESLMNSTRYLNQGMYQTDFYSFNYDTNKFHVSSKPADVVDFHHIQPLMPMKNEYATEEYKSVRHTWGPFATQDTLVTPRQFTNIVDGIMENNYINIFSDMVKMNGLFPGDTYRRCGRPVKINFPSINTKADKKARHKYLEGVYIIRNIQHIFEPDIYKQAITFVNDGIGSLDRTDVKGW